MSQLLEEFEEEWFSLEDIQHSDDKEKLYCISVDSPDRQFLAGLLNFPTHNTEEGKADDAIKGEASMIIGSIARLGRAAGVHLIIATQRPDASLLPGETKANLGVRVNCGRTDSNASLMILGNAEGTRVRANPKGRIYLQIYGVGDHGQGFFAAPDWIDNYLASQGLNPDGTPLGTAQSKLANVTDLSQFEGDTLDNIEGVDNAAIIEQIRQEESERTVDELDNDDFEDNFDEADFSDDSEVVEDSSSSVPEDPSGMGRPDLEGIQKPDKNPWERPEDDWDQDLENLINMNND